MEIMKVLKLILLVFCSSVLASSALGEASGPDFFKVENIDPGQTLIVYDGPSVDYPAIFELSGDRDALYNLGCVGALSYAEWQEATPEERETAANLHWCKIAFDGEEGWVQARYLGEGAAPKESQVLFPRSSSWRLISSPAGPSIGEATLVFSSDGSVSGDTGCNRFAGAATVNGQSLEMPGPLAVTKMFCPQPELMQQEDAILAALPEVTTYEFDLLSGRLTLHAADSSLLLSYEGRRD